MWKSVDEFFANLRIYGGVRVTIEFGDASLERMFRRSLIESANNLNPMIQDRATDVTHIMGIEVNLVSRNG